VFQLEKLAELPSDEPIYCAICGDPVGDSKHRIDKGLICNGCFAGLRPQRAKKGIERVQGHVSELSHLPPVPKAEDLLRLPEDPEDL
jgi:hypothetical protein